MKYICDHDELKMLVMLSAANTAHFLCFESEKHKRTGNDKTATKAMEHMLMKMLEGILESKRARNETI